MCARSATASVAAVVQHPDFCSFPVSQFRTRARLPAALPARALRSLQPSGGRQVELADSWHCAEPGFENSFAPVRPPASKQASSQLLCAWSPAARGLQFYQSLL